MKLNEWCNKNKLGYKILLADNVKNVNRLKRIANKEGCIVTNLEGCTITELAKRIVIEALAKEGKLVKVELADHDSCVLIINQLIKGDTTGKYSFIPKECLCVQTAEEILRVINALRLGNTTQEYDSTIVEKEKQIKSLISDYENKLNDEELYDKVSIIKAATKALNDGKVHVESEIGILSYLYSRYTYVEREFVSALTDSLVEIDCERVSNVDSEFYEVYGQTNEIQVVIEELASKGIPFGQVNILYSSDEYENCIRAALGERNIPFSFVSGCSVRDKSYVSFLLAIITWIKDDYSYDSFETVASSVLTRLGKDYSFGKKAGIGWGLDRYEMFVNKMTSEKASYQKLLLKHKRIREITSSVDGTVSIEDCSTEYVSFISNLVKFVLNTDKKPYNVGVIYRRLLQLIKDNTKEFGMDKKYLSLMEDKRRFFDLVGEAETFMEALNFIYDEVATLRMADSDESDAIIVMKMAGPVVLERPYQFCIGMSYDAFGAKTIDSPVLPDDRLSVLVNENSGYIDRILNRNLMKKENLIRSLSSMPDGNVTICANTYDTRNFRETAVSEAFIELKTKFGCVAVKDAGYSNKLELSKDYLVDKSKVYAGADTSGFTEPKKGYIEEEMVGGFRVVKLGKLSPTALHNLMSCPWKFDYLIKHFEEEGAKKDVTKWLPANEKGNLFHQIFQEYCDSVLIGKALGSADVVDAAALKAIVDNAIEEFEVLVPKGSAQAFDIECKLVREQTEAYISNLYADLKSNPKKWIVKECEREFTTEPMYIDENGDVVSAPGTCDVVEFSYHGFLDRIDSYVGADGIEHARIIDYKTGKKDKLEKKIKDNLQIQHTIYSIAATEDVDYFSYDFPCDGNKKIEKQGADIKEVPKEYREQMADVLLKGKYELLDDNACAFCDYKDICIHRMNLE